MALGPETVFPPPDETPEECAAVREAAIDTAMAGWAPEDAQHTYQLPEDCSARSADRVIRAYEAAGWQVTKTYTDTATTKGWLLTFRYLKG